MLVSAAAIAVTAKFDALTIPMGFERGPEPSPTLVESTTNEVRLGDDPALRKRATAPGKWTITDPRFGTIEVQIAPGQVPMTVIAKALAARGYTVSVPAS